MEHCFRTKSTNKEVEVWKMENKFGKLNIKLILSFPIGFVEMLSYRPPDFPFLQKEFCLWCCFITMLFLHSKDSTKGREFTLQWQLSHSSYDNLSSRMFLIQQQTIRKRIDTCFNHNVTVLKRRKRLNINYNFSPSGVVFSQAWAKLSFCDPSAFLSKRHSFSQFRGKCSN